MIADRLAALTLELVRVPSMTGQEEAIADLLYHAAVDRGAVVERRGNAVVARRPGYGQKIGLFGH
ncbi:MAG: succinyl-diaminopimelate desuccinylase, partial [Cyanobacteria bacterium REEB65]|nr:succinyl-diaminopimelate desuccinylase [Cyanobacteria bacterium REEB65]